MGACILIIEDNPANLELMTYLLGAFGHTVLAAEDGGQGLEAARRGRPDPIVGLALGADRFLFRPIEPEVFLAEIKACLRETERGTNGLGEDLDH